MLTIRVEEQISMSDFVGREEDLAAALQEAFPDADVGVTEPDMRGYVPHLEFARTVVVYLTELPWDEVREYVSYARELPWDEMRDALDTAVNIAEAVTIFEASRRWLTSRVRERVGRASTMDDRVEEVSHLLPHDATGEEKAKLIRTTSYKIGFYTPHRQLIATVEMTETMEEAVIKPPDQPQL